MEVAGLLTKEQLNGVFLNLDELLRVNACFAEKLKDAVDITAEQGDEVSFRKIFCILSLSEALFFDQYIIILNANDLQVIFTFNTSKM